MIMLFAGFNYLPQFKIFNIPIFQTLILFITLFAITNTVRQKLPPLSAFKLYGFYIIFSLPALLIGLLKYDFVALQIFSYNLFPFLVFLFTYNKISLAKFKVILIVLNTSMFLIVTIGWLIRLGIIPLNTLFEVSISEFRLGYWGISYQPSTRNHDYLYPLVGLAISSYLFVNLKNGILNLSLILIFIITLIACFSRGAIIIASFSILMLFRIASTNRKFIIISILVVLVITNLQYVRNEYQTTYKAIISSIFELKNKDNKFSNADRINVIEDAFKASILNPLGYGINNYGSIYKDTDKQISNSAENAYLTILVERGWLASFFFILTFISTIKNIINTNKIGLNHFLIPFLLIYFLFNYELNNAFACFIFYIIFLDAYLVKQPEICKIQKK
jgi:hypothetical protein